jgi:hypothetical protein
MEYLIPKKNIIAPEIKHEKSRDLIKTQIDYQSTRYKNPFHSKSNSYKIGNLHATQTNAFDSLNSTKDITLPTLPKKYTVGHKREIYAPQYCNIYNLKKLLLYDTQVKTQKEANATKYLFPSRSTISPIILFYKPQNKKCLSEVKFNENHNEHANEFPLRAIKENLIRNISLLQRGISLQNLKSPSKYNKLLPT